MAKLIKKITSAYEKVLHFDSEMDSGIQFEKDIDSLIREVQDDTELALMRGKVRHLGEPHMLLSALTSAVGLCHRPVHRIAMETQITEALEKYLGLKFRSPGAGRTRRKLLPHV